MNTNFKISERAEYHIYEPGQTHTKPYVSFNYDDARDAFRRGAIVYEYHIVRYSTEWTKMEHKIQYEWHSLDAEEKNDE